MGGESKSSQQSQSQPWQPTIEPLTGLIGQISGQTGNTTITPQETSAYSQLLSNAQSGNPYSGAIGGVASNLLAGGGANAQAPALNDNLAGYKSSLSPYLSSDYLDPMKSPGMANVLNTIRNDVGNSVNGQFAAAGRDLSGMNTQTLARGIVQGEAAPLLAQYNQNVATQRGAQDSLYGAGNTTSGLLSGLNQTGLTNQLAGVDASTAALNARDSGSNQILNIMQQQRAAPLSNIAGLANLLLPIAGLGGTSQASGTQNLSPVATALGWSRAASSLFG